MKRAKLVFPLVFVVALAGSAFTRQSRSTKKDSMIAYYYDYVWNTCNAIELDDDKCLMDDLGYPCQELIVGVGKITVYQGYLPNVCYQPFYSYFPD